MIGLDVILGIGSKLIDRLFPDPVEAEKAKVKLFELQQNGELEVLRAETQLSMGQIEINKEEAKSDNLFIAGWRPFVGWTCGVTLAYAALIEPLMRFVVSVAFTYTGTFPVIDTNITLQVLLGLLGLAGMRSWDKKNGVTK